MDILFQHGVHDILNLDGFTGVLLADLGILCRHHLVEIAEVTGRERFLLRQEHFPAGGIAAAFQRGEHHAGEVNSSCRVQR